MAALLWALAGMFHAGAGVRASDLVLPGGVADLVAEAEWVTVADLVGAQARRNARGNLIVTDYRFRVVQSMLGLPPHEFVLTQGGGTLAGETHALSDAPELAIGERYEAMIAADGRRFQDMTLSDMNAYWERAKAGS